jgi:hypothetical protein
MRRRLPDKRFEQEWDVAGEELRSILRNGSNVLVLAAEGLDGPAR